MGQITEQNIESFKEAYEKAVKNNEAYFEFEKQLVLVKYAKYVIEYFEQTNKNKQKWQ